MSVNPAYAYFRKVHYVDTDAMGVVHHSNYVRYFEEARVAWMVHHELMSIHYPYRPLHLAVVDMKIRYRKPCRFGDKLKIYVQSRTDGIRLRFRYAVLSAWEVESASEESDFCTVGETTLVPLSGELKPLRLPQELKLRMKEQVWIETWPLNLFE